MRSPAWWLALLVALPALAQEVPGSHYDTGTSGPALRLDPAIESPMPAVPAPEAPVPPRAPAAPVSGDASLPAPVPAAAEPASVPAAAVAPVPAPLPDAASAPAPAPVPAPTGAVDAAPLVAVPETPAQALPPPGADAAPAAGPVTVPATEPVPAYEAVVDELHQAMAEGWKEGVTQHLAPALRIYEQGYAELSRDAYADGHLDSDLVFAAATRRERRARHSGVSGDLAWVLTESRTRGEIGGQTVDLEQTETVLLQRIDAVWQVVHIHWSAHSRGD